MIVRWTAVAMVTLAVGCSDDGAQPELPLPEVDAAPAIAMRRLSVAEWDSTVRDLTGETEPLGRAALPEDFRTPFDNDAVTQVASRVYVEAVEGLAHAIAARTIASPSRRAKVLGCEPQGRDDAVCMKGFVSSLGRRALRRPLAESEQDELTAFGLAMATSGESFDSGARAVLAALLQDPEFLFRVERGDAVPDAPGVFKLRGSEIAVRLSYLVWGSSPDDALLDRAASGELDSAEGRAGAARDLLADSRARDQLARFHAQWLGYELLPHEPALAAAMQEESRALVERVLFDQDLPHRELFLAKETWLTNELAAHYELPKPTNGAGWVDVSGHGRAGILSQGAFLSVASNVLDTSPTKRGKHVRDRLLCKPVAPPPPDVMADSPPPEVEGTCKQERYDAHRADPACAGCHALMDPIGFGLERFDREGRYREFDYIPETTLPIDDCPVGGSGELPSGSAFSGPSELARLVVEDGSVETCFAEHVYRFAIGRALEADDDAEMAEVALDFAQRDGKVGDLIDAIVRRPAFALRREVTQ